MGVTLAKGGNVSLAKVAPNLDEALVGLGWDVRTTTGLDFDLDASALMLGTNGKVLSDGHFVFYNQLTSPDGTVRHTGDNRTGEGDGDDESIEIDLRSVPANVDKIVFAVSIHDAEARRQSFGQVVNAFIRSSTASTAARSSGTTCPRTPRPRRRWSSARSTATAGSGSSAPSGRVRVRLLGIAQDFGVDVS